MNVIDNNPNMSFEEIIKYNDRVMEERDILQEVLASRGVDV